MSRKKDIVWIIVTLLVCVLIFTAFKPTIVRETSMEPTLHDGDYVILNKISYKIHEPERGDIIVFKSDVDGGKYLIKRVVAVEGDEIAFLGNNVYLNGKVLNESYVKNGAEYIAEKNRLWDVPDDCIFAMGDNRDVSLDSRDDEVGFVKEKDIIGKFMIRLFPLSKIGINL